MKLVALLALMFASPWSRMGMSMFFLLIFMTGLCATVISFLVSLFLGADHDADHDIDHDVDHDADHHDVGGGGSHASILSIKIFMLFITGFGAGGFAGAQADFGVAACSLSGIVGGIVLGACGYLILDFFHRSQASSALRKTDLIGLEGVVTTTIPSDGFGEISCYARDQQVWSTARTNQATPIQTGTQVRITGLMGSIFIVEPVTK